MISSGIKARKREEIQALLSIAPVILIILAIKGYPLAETFIKSFTNWNGLGSADYIGFRNYTDILTGDEFWILIRNTFLLLLYVPLQALAGLVVAVLLYEEVPGWKLFRSIYYLPQIVSLVVIGYLFSIFFGYDGPVNFILRGIGMESLAVEWLGDAITAIPIIIFCLVWMNVGWQALIFTGGMSSIHPAIFDAANIDGVSYFQRLFKIIIPMLIRSLEYSFIMSVIWVFTSLFPIIYSMTNGGPGYETTTIDYMIYVKAFTSGSDLGAACALAVILTVLVLGITKLQMAVSNKSDDWGE